MELVTEFDLLGTHARNNCTVEEWQVVENFLIKGYCSTKEEALICYNNVLKNEFWYRHIYNSIFLYSSKAKPAVKFALTIAWFFSTFPISAVITAIVEKNNDEKASKRIEEIKKTLEAEINKTRTYINVSDSKEENLFLNYVNNLIDYIIAAKYPGYQSDLAQIREITYTYAKISPEETHDLDLAFFKRQECYSRLTKIQLNAYLKIEEMVKMQEANNEEQISDNKQNHLEQQLKNSIDKKIEEILDANLDDEKITEDVKANVEEYSQYEKNIRIMIDTAAQKRLVRKL